MKNNKKDSKGTFLNKKKRNITIGISLTLVILVSSIAVAYMGSKNNEADTKENKKITLNGDKEEEKVAMQNDEKANSVVKEEQEESKNKEDKKENQEDKQVKKQNEKKDNQIIKQNNKKENQVKKELVKKQLSKKQSTKKQQVKKQEIKKQPVTKPALAKSHVYANKKLGISMIFPANWENKYRIEESNNEILVYCKLNNAIYGEGYLFSVVKTTKKEAEEVLIYEYDTIPYVNSQININGITYFIGGPTDVRIDENRSKDEKERFFKMQKEIGNVVNTIKAIK